MRPLTVTAPRAHRGTQPETYETILKDAEQVGRVLHLLRGKYTRCVADLYGSGSSGGRCRKPRKKALTASLRALEDARLIIRRDLSVSRLHVQYELLEHARQPVIGFLDLLANWVVLEPPQIITEDPE